MTKLIRRDGELCQQIIMPQKYIPEGARLVEAYEGEDEIIVLGEPDDDDETHNCDQMGCTTARHVMWRVSKAGARLPSTDAVIDDLNKRLLNALQERDEWRKKALAVDEHPAIVALRQERDEARATVAGMRYALQMPDILGAPVVFCQRLRDGLDQARLAVENLTRERDEARAILDFHHRAAKLMAKRKAFIVIAHDESYFIAVYSIIRTSEIAKGRWTQEDEAAYQLAHEVKP